MKVLGYVRVSTEEQAKEGVSLERQAKQIEGYRQFKEWTLDEIIVDAGHSAKSLNRAGMTRLMELVHAGQVSTVIIFNLSRLTRSVADLDKLVKLFEKKGVALVSLQESLDATTATGRLMMNLIASISQWERERISERTKDALAALKAQGKPVGRSGLEDPATVARIAEDRAQGKSYEAIA
jgi:site-specific DNA recombinase